MTREPNAVTRVVGAALLDCAVAPTRLLAAQRAYPPALRGLWEFPGGKQEPQESVHAALSRECREELGVAITVLDEVPPPDEPGWPLTGTAVMRVFTAVLEDTPDGGAPAEHDLLDAVRAGADHLAVQWLPLAEPAAVLGLPWIPADLPIVAALLEQLRRE